MAKIPEAGIPSAGGLKFSSLSDLGTGSSGSPASLSAKLEVRHEGSTRPATVTKKGFSEALLVPLQRVRL